MACCWVIVSSRARSSSIRRITAERERFGIGLSPLLQAVCDICVGLPVHPGAGKDLLPLG